MSSTDVLAQLQLLLASPFVSGLVVVIVVALAAPIVVRAVYRSIVGGR